jgi:hypothetical protein
MTSHPYTEEQLVEQPAIGLFAELGRETVSALEETFGGAEPSPGQAGHPLPEGEGIGDFLIFLVKLRDGIDVEMVPSQRFLGGGQLIRLLERERIIFRMFNKVDTEFNLQIRPVHLISFLTRHHRLMLGGGDILARCLVVAEGFNFKTGRLFFSHNSLFGFQFFPAFCCQAVCLQPAVRLVGYGHFKQPCVQSRSKIELLEIVSTRQT